MSLLHGLHNCGVHVTFTISQLLVLVRLVVLEKQQLIDTTLAVHSQYQCNYMQIAGDYANVYYGSD